MSKKSDTGDINYFVLLEQAKSKLAATEQAINSDKLIAEKTAKDILVLKKEEKTLKDNIARLKEEEKISLASHSEASKKRHEAEDGMKSRQAKLQAQITLLEQKIDEEAIRRVKAQDKNNLAILNLQKILDDATEKHNEQIALLLAAEKTEEEKAQEIVLATEKQQAILDGVKALIDKSKEELAESNKVLAVLIQRKLEIENLDAEIATKKTSIQKAEAELTNIKASIE